MTECKWLLNKFARWESGGWREVKVPPLTELALMIEGTQLIVVNGRVVLESLSLTQSHGNTKAVYKTKTLAVGTKHQDKIARFRVMFDSEEKALNCISLLKRYINVSGETSQASADASIDSLSTATLSSILAEIMKGKKQTLPAPDSIPAEYPLESAVKLCILDPGFPDLVEKVDRIINKVIQSEKE